MLIVYPPEQGDTMKKEHYYEVTNTIHVFDGEFSTWVDSIEKAVELREKINKLARRGVCPFAEIIDTETGNILD